MANSEKLNYMYLRRKNKAWLPYRRSKNVKLEGRRREKQMMFRTLLESSDIKVTIFPTPAPALGSSAFAALSFSSSFWALVLSAQVWMKKKEADSEKKKTYFQNSYLGPLPCPC